MCAPSRHYYSSNKHLRTHTYAKPQDETTFFLLIKFKKNNEKKKNVEKNAIIFEGSIMDFSLFAQSFLLKKNYTTLIVIHFVAKKIINIFLFLHKLLRNIIIKHGKCSLSTTIFFIFFNIVGYIECE